MKERGDAMFALHRRWKPQKAGGAGMANTHAEIASMITEYVRQRPAEDDYSDQDFDMRADGLRRGAINRAIAASALSEGEREAAYQALGWLVRPWNWNNKGADMANTRITIEELEFNRWHAEIEVGGGSPLRADVNASTFGDILLAVTQKHAAMLPAPVARPEREIAADQAAVAKRVAELEAEADRAEREAERIADVAAAARTDARARMRQESDRLALEVEGIKARERAEHAEVPRTPSPAPLNPSEAKVDDARQSGASPPATGPDHVGGMRQREIDAPPSQPATDLRPTAAEASPGLPAPGVQRSDTSSSRPAAAPYVAHDRSRPLPMAPLTPAETKRMETLRLKRDADRTPAERQELRYLERRAE